MSRAMSLAVGTPADLLKRGRGRLSPSPGAVVDDRHQGDEAEAFGLYEDDL